MVHPAQVLRLLARLELCEEGAEPLDRFQEAVRGTGCTVEQAMAALGLREEERYRISTQGKSLWITGCRIRPWLKTRLLQREMLDRGHKNRALREAGLYTANNKPRAFRYSRGPQASTRPAAKKP